ncbi:MAG TPA: DUF2309 domain-containing protein [Polyangiales bacterium]
MKTTMHHGEQFELAASFEQAVQRACERIAPTWPLDRFIAVNPFWGFTNQPIDRAAGELAALSGAQLTMPRSWYAAQLASGQLRREHLCEAIELTGSSRTPEELIALLEIEPPSAPRRALLTDVADAQRDLHRSVAFSDFVRSDISQFCAAFFDDGQSQLPLDRTEGLYAAHRRHAREHQSPALLMGLSAYRELAEALPATADALIATALTELEVPADEREAYLSALLLDINGWAAWCAYLRWTARQRGTDDASLRELLAVRLSWEWLLHRAFGKQLRARWQLAMAGWASASRACQLAQKDVWVLQRAVELAYQHGLLRDLAAGGVERAGEQPAYQAVFCIDVRSEPLRRALERVCPAMQTLGFAGFFGVPAEYVPVGAETARPQLPGLLAPRLRITASTTQATLASRRADRLRLSEAWSVFRSSAASGFSFVESYGLLYGWKLLRDGLALDAQPAEQAGLTRAEHATCKPRLSADVHGHALSLRERADLAANVLRAMSLTRDLAPVVLLLGHGSQTVNNPHAAGLDCGACCGQTGEANARALAAILNDADVRGELKSRGIAIAVGTRFIAGLHNTTTDEVTLFDLDELPGTHAAQLPALHTIFAEAGRITRAERAGKDPLAGASADRAAHRRARDWSEVRPEWGLADNASFIVAPRARTRGLNLGGRAFLHEYVWQRDEGFQTLQLIMTAPMVVAHWINLQYYASVVDNPRYGSGNKVLHNVVGRHLGVFEGNGGDLRIGLPLQSLHDGSKWVHTPLRLSVVIEAPRAAIADVLARHDKVRELVEYGWLHLYQLDAEQRALFAYRQGHFQRAYAR